MIPNSIFASMIGELIFIVTLPLALIIILKMRTKASILPMFVGCLVFYLFAMQLEGILHGFVLSEGSPVKDTIMGSAAAYTLYVSIAAGVFEESGRFLAVKYFLRNNQSKKDALSYGIGHGAMETIVVVAFPLIINIAYASITNEMGFDAFVASFPEENQAVVTDLINELQTLNASECFLASFERLTATVCHLSLSVIVFFAVNKKLYKYYGAAILLHAIVNVPVALTQFGVIKNLFLAEIIVTILVAGVAYIAYKLYTSTEDPFNFGKPKMEAGI